MAPLFSLVKDVNPSITVRAMRLRLVYSYELRSKGTNSTYGLNCIFHDLQEQRIEATIKTDISRFGSALKDNHVYLIKDFIVAQNEHKYRSTDHRWRLAFTKRTVVTVVYDETFPRKMFDLKPFEYFSYPKSLNQSLMIDVVGKLTTRYSPQLRVLNSGETTQLLNLVLEDESGSTVKCSLWGEYVDIVMNFLERKFDPFVVILMQMCQVKTYTGEAQLNNSFMTRLFINDDIPEIRDFRTRYLERAVPTSSYSHVSLPNNQSIESELAGHYWVSASIAALECGTDWWYHSCNYCPKKLIVLEGKFSCKVCGDLDGPGRIRYMVQVRVVDHTGDASFMLWDREVTNLLGKTAYEMRGICGDNVLPDEITALADKRFLFKLSLKDEHLGASNRVYSVGKLTNDVTLIQKNYFLEDGQPSDMFSSLKNANTDTHAEVSSGDEVSTPVKKPNDSQIPSETAPGSSLKRRLFDESSSTAKDKGKKPMIDVKQESE